MLLPKKATMNRPTVTLAKIFFRSLFLEDFMEVPPLCALYPSGGPVLSQIERDLAHHQGGGNQRGADHQLGDLGEGLDAVNGI